MLDMLINSQPKGSPPNIEEKILSPKGNPPIDMYKKTRQNHMVCGFTQETVIVKNFVTRQCSCPFNTVLILMESMIQFNVRN